MHDVNIPFRLHAYWYATEYPYACSDHTSTEMQSKDTADVNKQANYNCRSSLQGTLARLAVATGQVPVDSRQPIWFQASTWGKNGHICTQANSGFVP